MKRNFVVMAFTALILGLCCMSCEKENNTAENTSPTLKNLKISDIKVQDGMLCFESWEQYEQTIHALAEACENHVAKYIDSIIEVLGTDDEEAINEQIAKDGFSQFTPLHDFANALRFNSMYELLEKEETEWLNNPYDSISPFDKSALERYQSALHNTNGDVMVCGKVFNPEKESDDDCKASDKLPNEFPHFWYKDKERFIKGKISTTAVSFSASTTAYYIDRYGRKILWSTKGLTVSMHGEKTTNCEYGNPVYMIPKTKHRPNLYLTYVSVFESITSWPNYINPNAQMLISDHSIDSQNGVFHLGL